MEYVSFIDENKVLDKLSNFVAKDLKRIPTIPSEHTDIYYVAKKMELLEQRMAAMEGQWC